VKIIFKNEGKAPHNLVIQGLGIGTRTIGVGQTDTIEFTAPSSGTYTFYCSVPGHRAAGMEGRLEVK
jgi:nitrite reductase (NO-forming)